MMDMTTQGEFILAPGEFNVICPYNMAHVVTNARLITHLTKCRTQYQKDCERTGKPKDMRICNFNDNHRVFAPEINFHHERCEDRYKVVETIRYHASDEFARKIEADRRRKEEDETRFGGTNKDKHDQDKKDHKSRSKDAGHSRHKYDEDKRSSSRSKHRDEKPAPKIWGDEQEDWESESKGYEAAYDPQEKLSHGGILYQPRGLSKSERKQFRAEQKEKANQRSLAETESLKKLDLEATPTIKKERKEEVMCDAPSPSSSYKIKKEFSLKKEPVVVKKIEKKEEYDDFTGEDPFS